MSINNIQTIPPQPKNKLPNVPTMRNYLVRAESPLWLSFVRQNAKQLDWIEISKMETLSDAFVAEFWEYLIHALIDREMNF